jgi:DNA-binding MarR family transcriptional regulator
MIEKIRSISNPLTIIAIFAALAEVAGAVTLPLVADTIQATYIWFVMSFPVILVIAFFATLNFNPTVLYAPSDYKNEDNFLNMTRRGRDFERSLDQLNEQLEKAKTALVDEIKQEADKLGGAERERLSQVASDQIRLIKGYVDSARVIGEDLAATAEPALPHSALQADILKLLASAASPQSLSSIAASLRMSEAATGRALSKLSSRGLIETYRDGGEFFVRRPG